MDKLTDLQKIATKFIRDDSQKFTIRKELRLLKEHQNMISSSKLILKELYPDENYSDSDIIRMFISNGFNELQNIFYNKISKI